ncbi:MAG: hypothetical protein WAK20_01965 [Candidatus Acidiferrum sp.]
MFVKVIQPENNYEIYLGDLNSSEQVRLTYDKAFDVFPVISHDRDWLLFASSRDVVAGPHTLTLFLMDISSLHVGPPAGNSSAKWSVKSGAEGPSIHRRKTKRIARHPLANSLSMRNARQS